jgi:hypothetical protein
LRAAMSAFGLHTPCVAQLLRQNGSIRRANCAPQSHFGPKHQHAVSSRPVKYANPQCESPRHKPLGRHGVPIVTKDLQSDISRGRKMGKRVPIFPKNACYQYPANSQRRQIYGGFQGAQAPWRGLGRSPKRTLRTPCLGRG